MGNRSEKDVEALLRGGVPVRAGHKEALRQRLFDPMVELGLDDLENVVGGAAQGGRLRLEDWTDGFCWDDSLDG